MAKGNLFQGMARGKVGDVVFSRVNGEQISRVRNRNPKNPKTNAQKIQRAVMATVLQAYKAGSIIFDHSFEGKSVPAGSQRAFLSTNMRKLREQILNEINSVTPNETISRVVSPRAVYPVPNGYRISEGSLIQNLFIAAMDGNDHIIVKPVDALEGETVAAFLSRLGIVPNDIFTICSFGALRVDNWKTTLISPQCTFGFMRLTVKEAAATSTTLVSAATYQDVFDIDSAGAVLPTGRLLTAGISVEDLDFAGANNGSMGVIRSNENSGLRSSSDMFTPNNVEDGGEMNEWGVLPTNLLESWSQESGGTESELILEGGEI